MRFNMFSLTHWIHFRSDDFSFVLEVETFLKKKKKKTRQFTCTLIFNVHKPLYMSSMCWLLLFCCCSWRKKQKNKIRTNVPFVKLVNGPEWNQLVGAFVLFSFSLDFVEIFQFTLTVMRSNSNNGFPCNIFQFVIRWSFQEPNSTLSSENEWQRNSLKKENKKLIEQMNAAKNCDTIIRLLKLNMENYFVYTKRHTEWQDW